MRREIRRLRELYEVGGPPEVARGIRDYALDRTPYIRDNTYYKGRNDNEDRWVFMRPYLDGATGLLDIGCAEGYFTAQAANYGLVSIGIDNDVDRLKQAQARTGFAERCGFLRLHLSPENIYQLPRFDVILLLTVHHHWEGEYGLEEAERMFRTVMDRCDLLVYEPPGDRPIVKDHMELNVADSMAFYTDRLSALYGDAIEILDAEMVSYSADRQKGRERADPIFVINTSEYEAAPNDTTEVGDGFFVERE